jgi:class 3 adenylate cyclase
MRQLISQALTALTRLLYQRTILILTLLFCAGVAAALWNMSRLSSNLIESQALQNAALYSQAIKEARTLYSTDAVDRVKAGHGIIITHDYANKEGAIPLPATYLIKLGATLSEKNPGMSIRVYSDYPFPWRRSEGGPRDNFEREALRNLRQNPKQAFFRFETFQGRPSLRYAQADILKPSCVACHNTHPDSPKTDWKVGDVRGILEITSPLDNLIAQTHEGLRGTFFMLSLLCVLGVFGLTLVIGRLRQTSKELERRVIERTAQLQEANEQLSKEQEKSERLLLNILPESIAEQLKQGHSNIADGFAEVTILFADIVNFTQLSERVSPTELLKFLNEIFTGFDRLTEQHGLEKIKTIGDAYMVVGGIPIPRSDHAEAVAEMALDMQQEVARFNAKHSTALSIRIGINTGPVVAGVIGTKKFIYDLWGDAVNTASRMESHGLPGYIQVTESTYERLRDKYLFKERGVIDVKGKGEMTTYLLTARKVQNLARNL